MRNFKAKETSYHCSRYDQWTQLYWRNSHIWGHCSKLDQVACPHWVNQEDRTFWH